MRVVGMTIDFKEAAFLVHQTFRELSVHELSLATSLQSLVPSNKEQPSKSAQYLYDNGVMLKELSERVKELIVPSSGSPEP
jgi:hypothetical protein